MYLIEMQAQVEVKGKVEVQVGLFNIVYECYKRLNSVCFTQKLP